MTVAPPVTPPGDPLFQELIRCLSRSRLASAMPAKPPILQTGPNTARVLDEHGDADHYAARPHGDVTVCMSQRMTAIIADAA